MYKQPIPSSQQQGDADPSSFESKKEYYHKRLDSILNRELNPDTITDYASSALNDLVALLEDMIVSTGHIRIDEYTRRDEERVLSEYAMPDRDTILDHMIEVEGEIRKINDQVRSAHIKNHIIIPPDEINTRIIPGSGTYEVKRIFERTTTALFLLKNDFDIDIDDEESVKISRGIIQQNQMRKISYYLLEVPELDRLILTCDEEGNASFVFNSQELKNLDLSSDDISEMTKDELKQLIQEHKQVGTRLVYSPKFLDDLRHAIDYPATVTDGSKAKTTNPDANKYLKPLGPRPEGYLTYNEIAKELGLSDGTILNAIKQLNIEVEQYRHENGNPSKFYSPEQTEQIKNHLKELLELQERPEGYLTYIEIAKELGLADQTILRAIKQLNIVGETYRHETGNPSKFYSPEQTEQIRDELIRRGLIKPKSD